MTSSLLKWIALLTMLIDHIGAIFFPQHEIFRIIGRISFPIFAFLLVQGFTHTRSRNAYLIRLLVFALIAEIPFDLCFSGVYYNFYSQSIMFELLIGFMALVFAEKARKKPLYFFIVALLAFFSELIYASYGAYGIVLITFLYLLRRYRGADILALLGITYLFYGFTSWGFSIVGYNYSILTLNSVQLYACFSAVLLVFYNGKRGGKSYKWLFYIFYPVHLFAIHLIDKYIY